MHTVWEALLLALPAAPFVPIVYLLLRFSTKSDADGTESANPRCAALLMSAVLIVLILVWIWTVCEHFLG